MAKNEGGWGRSKARERYASGGDVPVIKIPMGKSGLKGPAASQWRSNTKPGSMNHINIKDEWKQKGGEGIEGTGPRLQEENFKRGGSMKHSDAAQDKKLIKKMINEKAAGKFARGGKAGKTNINIVIAPQGKEAAPPPPMPIPIPPRPPMAPPPMPTGGGGMPGQGMKRGGSVKMTAGAESGVGRLQKAGFDYKSVRRG